MGSWIVKQPNGLYARFSTVVDDFTHMNLTGEEALDVCMDDVGRAHAREKMNRAEEEAPTALSSGVVPDVRAPLARWHEALENLRDPADYATRVAQDRTVSAARRGSEGGGR